jgi:hypothetical protein
VLFADTGSNKLEAAIRTVFVVGVVCFIVAAMVKMALSPTASEGMVHVLSMNVVPPAGEI